MENIEKNIKDFLYFAEFGENKSLNTIKSLKKIFLSSVNI